MTLGILRVGLYEGVVVKCVKGSNMKGEIPLGNFRENVQNRSLIFMRSTRCFEGFVQDVAVITGMGMQHLL